MIRDRKQSHIGLGTKDIKADAQWYMDVLGFQLIGDFITEDGTPIKFLQNNDVIYEMFQADLPEAVAGKIDHYSFQSEDIEADYQYCLSKGYAVDGEIQCLPTLWEKGVRFFFITSPTGERLEFCQRL